MLYVEIDGSGNARHLHYAPYLDYRALTPEDPNLATLLSLPEAAWITHDIEKSAIGYAVSQVVPDHLREVKDRRINWIKKTRDAVKDRLIKEINYWDNRANQLLAQEQAGKSASRLNSKEARRRADDLQSRLERRLEELDREEKISALPPVVLGGVAVIPRGLIDRISGKEVRQATHPIDTQQSAARARAIVMEIERKLGHEPVDRELEKLGYDIESRAVKPQGLRFIEVKGRVAGAETITVTRNEIRYSFHEPEKFILALVEFQDDERHRVVYLRRPFEEEGITRDFNGASVNFSFADLLSRGSEPS
jgi:hypothetical protein